MAPFPQLQTTPQQHASPTLNTSSNSSTCHRGDGDAAAHALRTALLAIGAVVALLLLGLAAALWRLRLLRGRLGAAEARHARRCRDLGAYQALCRAREHDLAALRGEAARARDDGAELGRRLGAAEAEVARLQAESARRSGGVDGGLRGVFVVGSDDEDDDEEEDRGESGVDGGAVADVEDSDDDDHVETRPPAVRRNFHPVARSVISARPRVVEILSPVQKPQSARVIPGPSKRVSLHDELAGSEDYNGEHDEAVAPEPDRIKEEGKAVAVASDAH